MIRLGCTGAEFGTGNYCHGLGYSRLKSLVLEGKGVLQAKGLEGGSLEKALRLYVRATANFHQQSGWQTLSKELINEFADRILAELAVSYRSHQHTQALSIEEFSCGESPKVLNISMSKHSSSHSRPDEQAHSPPD